MKTYIRVIVGDAKVLKRPHRRDIIVELIDEIGKPIAEPVRFYQEIEADGVVVYDKEKLVVEV